MYISRSLEMQSPAIAEKLLAKGIPYLRRDTVRSYIRSDVFFEMRIILAYSRFKAIFRETVLFEKLLASTEQFISRIGFLFFLF